MLRDGRSDARKTLAEGAKPLADIGVTIGKIRFGRMMKASPGIIAALACLSLALSACQTRRPNASAAFIAALQGGLAAKSGIELDKSDRQRALEAEYRALEAAAVGQPVVWKGGDASGSVVAAAPYQVGSQNCRQYTHTLTVDGNQTTARGTACRNDDGSWSLL